MKQINTNEWEAFNLSDVFDFLLPIGDLQVKKVEYGDKTERNKQ